MDSKRISRSPLFVPAASLLFAALLLAINPSRHQVLDSLMGSLPEPGRLIPLAPNAAIPTLFAKWLWGCAVFGTWGWLAVRRFRRAPTAPPTAWKLIGYGSASLPIYAASGLVFWTTMVQFWTSSRWSSDAAQGWCLLVFAVSYAWSVGGAVYFCMKDLAIRCPVCLKRTCMPLETGRQSSVLMDVSEVESICLQGHGAVSHTRWAYTFRPVTGFWKQLLR